MSQTVPVSINFKGGIVSPGYLKEILNIASVVQVPEARFGLRQQLILDIPARQFDQFTQLCSDKNILFQEGMNEYPNIVSSYSAVNIFSQENWLSQGVYKDIFDLFNYQPRIKINICGSNQNFTPFFTGNLNWLSSAHPHYWYLFLRYPGSDAIHQWPELIYTNDIPRVSKLIEELTGKNNTYNGNQHMMLNSLVQPVQQSLPYISRPVTTDLELPPFHLPYYEGFNKDGDSFWLGIYRRDELFSVDFLRDVCNICLQTRIGEIYTTSWKSIIIKGIQEENRNLWDRVMGKYRINVRHAANELNWQVEDRNEDGLILKRHIIRHFDKEDVRTFGLSFAVKTKTFSNMFGSVIISKQDQKYSGHLKSMDRFDVLYKKDFNPNSAELLLHRRGVKKDQLGTYLVSLCKQFYEQEGSGNLVSCPEVESANEGLPKSSDGVQVYQCRNCLSVYDGTLEGAATDHFQCAVCDATVEDFYLVDEKTLGHIS